MLVLISYTGINVNYLYYIVLILFNYSGISILVLVLIIYTGVSVNYLH